MSWLEVQPWVCDKPTTSDDKQNLYKESENALTKEFERKNTQFLADYKHVTVRYIHIN